MVAQSTAHVEEKKEEGGDQPTGIPALDQFENYVQGKLALLAGQKNKPELVVPYCRALDAHLANIGKRGWQPPSLVTEDEFLDRFYDEQSWMLQGLLLEQQSIAEAYISRLRGDLNRIMVRHNSSRAQSAPIEIDVVAPDVGKRRRSRSRANRDNSNLTPAQRAYGVFRQPEQTLMIDLAIFRKIDTSPDKKVSFSALLSALIASGFLLGEDDRNALTARNNRMREGDEPLLTWTSAKPIFDISMTTAGSRYMIELNKRLEAPEKAFLAEYAPWVLSGWAGEDRDGVAKQSDVKHTAVPLETSHTPR